MKFDYNAPAELFLPKRKAGRYKPIAYRRFPTAAEAIRFAVENLPAISAVKMYVGDKRFYSDEIRGLYDDKDYPLPKLN